MAGQQSATEMLKALSEGMADAVEFAAQSVVTVNARRRLSVYICRPTWTQRQKYQKTHLGQLPANENKMVPRDAGYQYPHQCPFPAPRLRHLPSRTRRQPRRNPSVARPRVPRDHI